MEKIGSGIRDKHLGSTALRFWKAWHSENLRMPNTVPWQYSLNRFSEVIQVKSASHTRCTWLTVFLQIQSRSLTLVIFLNFLSSIFRFSDQCTNHSNPRWKYKMGHNFNPATWGASAVKTRLNTVWVRFLFYEDSLGKRECADHKNPPHPPSPHHHTPNSSSSQRRILRFGACRWHLQSRKMRESKARYRPYMSPVETALEPQIGDLIVICR